MKRTVLRMLDEATEEGSRTDNPRNIEALRALFKLP
jgi:hypothetical protein